MKSKPIGIFDSGIGGLTVVKAITEVLPQESLIYLGDTARVPYGTRGKEIITQFALELTKFLLKQDVKYIVVACNTISATCLDKIQTISTVPVLGVIKPAVQKIINTTKTKKVAIIGTRATITSRVYENEIRLLDPEIKVFTKACPLFVPIAEEGLADSEIAVLTAKEYLKELILQGIDTLHLGCTHYPLLKNTIQKVIGSTIKVIDSAEPVAQELKKRLLEKNLVNNTSFPKRTFYLTDAPERAYKIVRLFLGKDTNLDLRKIELK